VRRIYWDSMLLIYLLEGHSQYASRVVDLLEVSKRRMDRLFTSYLGLGELMAGAKATESGRAQKLQREVSGLGFSYLPFDGSCVSAFALLRGTHRVKSADAIHLACAGGAGIDLFLTGDKQLMKLEVPGINFIADFDTPLLQI
jgi:predicted nucleic acid-binding protein